MLILIGIFVLCGVAEYGIHRLIIYPSFLALERDEAQKDLERSVQALKREIHRLDTLARIWSSRNDNYEFVKTPFEDYVRSRPILSSLLEKSVNLIYEKLDVADALATELKKSNVVIRKNAKVKEISGDTSVKEIILADGSKIPLAGVFIELGARGVMELAAHIGIQFDDEMKYIDTNKKMETNVPGVFAAGDICGPPWQMAKAVGEGCVAGIAAATYAKKMRKSE